VLDRRHAGGDPVLTALEVDLAVQALGAAAAVAGGLAPVRVAAARLLQALGERLLRGRLGDLGEVRVRREATAGAGGLGLADGHQMFASWPACHRGRAGSSWSRTQGEAHAWCMGEPEDADPAKVMCAIRGCGGRGAG